MPNVLIPFSTGVEEIELIAIVDILRRANLEVTVASFNGKAVTGRSNIIIQPDKALDDILNMQWDMIVLPGGLPNAQLLADNSHIQNIVRNMSRQEKYIAAICAAPKALANFGLLYGKKVTSHPSVREDILNKEPSIIYLEGDVVIDGNIITSRGAGTAVSFALALVTVLTSQEVSNQIKASILA